MNDCSWILLTPKATVKELLPDLTHTLYGSAIEQRVFERVVLLSDGLLVQTHDERQLQSWHDYLRMNTSADTRFNEQRLSVAEYQDFMSQEPQGTHTLTIFSQRLDSLNLTPLFDCLQHHQVNISGIRWFSSPYPNNCPARAAVHSDCLKITVDAARADLSLLRQKCDSLALRSEEMDIVLQQNQTVRCRLAVFDMDSTLIEQEVIDELAAEAGRGKEVAKITEQAMLGHIDFRDSLQQRVALLKGLNVSAITAVLERLRLTPGAERLIHHLHKQGCITAIVTGGFRVFGEVLQRRLGINHLYANALESVDGHLTGRTTGEVIDAQGKARCVRQLAFSEGIDLAHVLAVGDGSNDIEMLRTAGLGVAFHAKPAVRAVADVAIQTAGLDAIIALLG